MQTIAALTQEQSSLAVGVESVDSGNMAHQEQEQQHIKNLVQIFLLVKPDEWEDRGYGIVGFEWDEELENLHILVRSREHHHSEEQMLIKEGPAVTPSTPHPTPLIDSIVKPQNNYGLQDGSIITWTEANDELQHTSAISFQSPDDCAVIWELLQNRLQKMAGSSQMSDGGSVVMTDGSDLFLMGADDEVELALPEPSFDNLVTLDQIFLQITRSYLSVEKVAAFIVEFQLIPKLISLFRDLEDLENVEDIYHISNILRHSLFLCHYLVYDVVLQDEYFGAIVGILEYDKEYPQMQSRFREMLTAKFKEVVPISDEELVTRIKKAYRAQFLKEVVLARVLDDSVFGFMSSLIQYIQSEIIDKLMRDSDVLTQLFNILSDETGGINKKKDVIMFLHELCLMSNVLDAQNRGVFYNRLGQHGLFAIFDYTLADSDRDIRISAASMLFNILEHDPSLVRSFCLAQIKENQRPLFDVIIENVHADRDTGLCSQYLDILRILIEPPASASTSQFESQSLSIQQPHASDPEYEEFLSAFYEKHIAKLMQPILSLTKPIVSSLDMNSSDSLDLLCDFLIFCIIKHSYRSKYFILSCDINIRVTLLLTARHAFLRSSGLRVFRAQIGMKDEFYNRHMLKYDIFGPIMTALLTTNGRNNLLNSGILELLEFIRKENIKTLLAHIVTAQRKSLDSIDYIHTARELIARHEQNSEPSSDPETLNSGSVANTQKDGWSKIDQAEDSYFHDDDDDDGDAALVSSLTADMDADESNDMIATSSDTEPPASLTALQAYRDSDDEDGGFLTTASKSSLTKPRSLSISISKIISLSDSNDISANDYASSSTNLHNNK